MLIEVILGVAIAYLVLYVLHEVGHYVMAKVLLDSAVYSMRVVRLGCRFAITVTPYIEKCRDRIMFKMAGFCMEMIIGPIVCVGIYLFWFDGLLEGAWVLGATVGVLMLSFLRLYLYLRFIPRDSYHDFVDD